MKFTIRAKSPLHVGDGATLAWLDWFLDDAGIHVIDVPAILEQAAVAREDVAEEFARFTDHVAGRMREVDDQLDEARGRAKDELMRGLREESSPLRFLADGLKNDVLARAVAHGDFDRYRVEFWGGRLDRRLEIRSQAKDANGGPTIPGSTLKGQLRSALAHAALATAGEEVASRVLAGGDGLHGWNRDLAESTPGRARFRFATDLEARLFRTPSGSRSHVDANDRRVDLLRFLSVSDPVRSRASLVALRVSPFKKAKGKQGDHLVPVQPSMIEAIAPGGEFEFELRVDALALKRAANAPNSGFDPLARDEFFALFARTFGPSRDDLRAWAPAEIEERVLSAVEV